MELEAKECPILGKSQDSVRVRGVGFSSSMDQQQLLCVPVLVLQHDW